MRGKFIVIEGGDGAGKDTHVALLKKDFPAFVYTREPGGTPLGKVLRDMVLHEAYGLLPLMTEAFLFLADRAQHAAEVVAPALAAGTTVVSNRSWLSLMAYQVYGRNQLYLKPIVESATTLIYKDCPIDLAVVLDVSPEIGLSRQRAAGKKFDVMESMSLESHERIRQGFLTIVQGLPQAKVVDASRSMEAVYADVKAAVEAVVNP